VLSEARITLPGQRFFRPPSSVSLRNSTPVPSSPHSRDLDFTAANRLLSALPEEEYARLLPSLTRVRLPRGRVLFEAGETVRHVYFLAGGMASLLATTAEGDTVQVAMIGREGVVGLPALLGSGVMPYRVTAQLSGSALRISAAALDAEFRRGDVLRDLLLRYLYTLLTQITQSALCNRYHTIGERLCRWLLISRDRSHSDVLALTQESLSHMLGAQRTGVTAAASALQRSGLIAYRHGQIRLLDQKGLEERSCECYAVITRQIESYLAA
jgi:CRP-like cAMP-binding protein